MSLAGSSSALRKAKEKQSEDEMAMKKKRAAAQKKQMNEEEVKEEEEEDEEEEVDNDDDDDDDDDMELVEDMITPDQVNIAAMKGISQFEAANSTNLAMDTDSNNNNNNSNKPNFPQLSASEASNGKSETRKVLVPPHRYTPLKEHWLKIYGPVVQHMKLQIRMNVKARAVEIRTSPHTEDSGALQKAADFVRAFMLGFDIQDAIALLRLDNLYIDTFEIVDVKPLHGDHLSRAIGRIAGKNGKTKFTIENVTKTRIVLADSKIHILGSFQNIKLARDAVVSLILGSPPGKVYGQLRSVASRMSERF